MPADRKLMDEHDHDNGDDTSATFRLGRERRARTLDALADLYLTGTPAAERDRRDDDHWSRPSRHDAGPSRTGGNWLPTPSASLPPKVSVTATATAPPPAPPVSPAGRQARDSHSGRGAAAGEPDRLGEPEPDRAAAIEVVFLGNLPGFGGPWLTQYAHHLAASDGPIGVIQVAGRHVDLSLVTAGEPAFDVDEDLNGTQAERGASLMGEALRRLAAADARPARWLVCVPVPATRQTTQVAAAAARWTLLCGADDAAVVGAYRLLKQMVAAVSDELDTPRPDRHVRLMVMGADEPASRATAKKLNATAGSFLATPVRLVGWRKRIQPVRQDHLGTWEMDEQEVWPDIEAMIAEASRPTRSPRRPRRVAPPRRGEPRHPTSETVGGDTGVPRQGRHAGVCPPIVVPEPAPSRPTRKPESAEANARPDAGELDLAAYLEPADRASPAASRPGLVRLDARCPDQPAAQLAVARDGRLHLCLRDPWTQGATNGMMDARSVRAAITDLMQLENWSRRHLDLLRLTTRQPINQAPPELHLFTGQPKAAAAIASNWGESIKIHVLQQVRVGNSTAWCCVDLT